MGSQSFFPKRDEKGVHTLQDIVGMQGLREFQDLQRSYNLPGTSFFFYLQLRASMRAYGVPWDLNTHPLHLIFNSKRKNNGIVSDLYKFINKAAYKVLPLDRLWKSDIAIQADLDWCTIWVNVSLSSRNLNHQMIHYKFIHRSYLMPQRLLHMKLRTNPYCDFCPDNTIGTFFHMIWQCPEVNRFWKNISSTLSDIIGRAIPHSEHLLLLNDTSSLQLNITDRRLLLAGLTAAKKIVVCRWKSPHTLSVREWISSYRDIIQLELSTARLHCAKTCNIICWSKILEKIKIL